MTEQTAKEIFHITDLNTDTAFNCSEETSLLVGMERSCSSSISVGCRGGGCGVCKIQIISGRYSNKRMSKAHVSEEDVTQGIVLACRVFPQSDMTIKPVID